ncbi:MAG TPA: acetyl-CoA carboxylase biotin carboxylase subunit [bacterium]|jgi:propionyl-CoA carboxylase alpha chain
MIKSVLIANRGEIAVRIARTCREMGIRTIGVYSEADRNAMHVSVMDEAHDIGPAPATESYLRQDRLLAVAARTKAEAVHPGYGFLAENAVFAQHVAEAGLIWVGPPASAIAAMGSKTGARALMLKANVPILPGSEGPIRAAKDGELFAKKVGYPILLKAVAGGGGKGMRVVHGREEMWNAFEAAGREAAAAFGDGAVYGEKYLPRARHIEIQIMADQHGNVVYLGERECSIQRRHQKIIEESPSVAVSSTLRQRMGDVAVAAAKACGYTNAGTVEMLLDENGKFYFLEMNTRLQVEHPVTEEITGLDLVRMQLDVAAGGKLSLSQDEVTRRGHAIEVRLYAEDVPGGFLPSTGVLKRLRPPSGPGIREDSGLREGGEVTRFYDPMISKLIVRAETREAARVRMIRALQEYQIAGVRTNIPFCLHILKGDAFAKGDYHTRSGDTEFYQNFLADQNQPVEHEETLAAALAHVTVMSERAYAATPTANGVTPQDGAWRASGKKRAMGGA